MCKFFTTFAPDMKKTALLIVLFASLVCAHAETLLLRTGARVKGEIIFQNDDVVVLRDAETGARSQYPRSDIEQILEKDLPEVTEQAKDETEELPEITTPKKASILVELGGGAAVIPGGNTGGGFGADLLVGSHHIGGRHIFVGAGLGYHGLFIGEEKYNFLPIQAAVRMPFAETKHSPVFGAAVGYGIALSKDYTGGLYAGLDLGYRCQLNPKSALAITAFAQFQQAVLTVTETVEDVEFVHKTGRNLVVPGIKMAFYF